MRAKGGKIIGGVGAAAGENAGFAMAKDQDGSFAGDAGDVAVLERIGDEIAEDHDAFACEALDEFGESEQIRERQSGVGIVSGVSCVLHQNPIDGFRKIVHDGVGLARPIFGVPGFVAQAVAVRTKTPLQPARDGQFHVAIAVANHEGARQIEMVFPRGAFDHAGFRLAAIASVRGAVRAIVNSVDDGTDGSEFAAA